MAIHKDFPTSPYAIILDPKTRWFPAADAAAGAFFNALERDNYGNTEPKYLQILSPILYRHEKNLNGYGLKIMPKEAIRNVESQKCLEWLKSIK